MPLDHPVAEAMESDAHPLQHTWVLWEQRSISPNASPEEVAQASQEICEFSTVEDFWKYWTYFPRPTDVFNQGLDDRTIDGFALFKKGVRPTCDDPAVKAGGMWSARVAQYANKSMNTNEVNEPWQNIVFALIGEVLDDSDELVGVRVMDKTKVRKSADGHTERRAQAYRLEIWTKSTNANTEALRNRIQEAACETEGATSKRDALSLDFQFSPFDIVV